MQVFPRLIQLQLSADEIKSLTERAIQDARSTEDAIAILKRDVITVRNTLESLADKEATFSLRYSSITFPLQVSPDKTLREVSTECRMKLDDFQVESGLRADVYKVMKELKSLIDSKQIECSLKPEEERFLERVLRDFRRNGLDLAEEKRAIAEKLQKREAALGTQFEKNMNEDTTELNFTEAELEGLPEQFLQKLKRTSEGKYIVTLKYPDLFPVLRLCKVENTRRIVAESQQRQCLAENTPLLEECLLVRQELSTLLGYPTHADLNLEVRMAKNKENVFAFLNDLKGKLIAKGQQEIDTLLDLKKSEKEQRGEPFDGKFYAWDFRYYHNLLLSTKYQVDHEAIRQYFPLDVVIVGMFRIYQQLLGLRFEHVTSPADTWLPWHDDVSLYHVFDSDTNSFVGSFYLDLFPRDGKFSHAAAFPLQKRTTLYEPMSGTTELYPITAMVCNFSRPTESLPSLLDHDEVTTFFHEFGHVMHNVCGTSRINRFSGTSVERDFVEAPSQMLENWCWEGESLCSMSARHDRRDEPLPQEQVQKLVAAKNVNVALHNLRQLFFALFDMEIHTRSGAVNTQEVYHKLHQDVFLIPPMEGTNGAASFGHLMGGYDAGYYSYLWSEVFSADMFEHFKASTNGILDGATGRRYRQHILAPGGSMDADVLLRNFLGRDPTQDAFLRSIGVL